MKSAIVETQDMRTHHIIHVTDVTETGDFMVIMAAHPNGQTESHRFATYTIHKLSYYDMTDVVTKEEDAQG